MRDPIKRFEKRVRQMANIFSSPFIAYEYEHGAREFIRVERSPRELACKLREIREDVSAKIEKILTTGRDW